jgi:hypothetical protein
MRVEEREGLDDLNPLRVCAEIDDGRTDEEVEMLPSILRSTRSRFLDSLEEELIDRPSRSVLDLDHGVTSVRRILSYQRSNCVDSGTGAH